MSAGLMVLLVNVWKGVTLGIHELEFTNIPHETIVFTTSSSFIIWGQKMSMVSGTHSHMLRSHIYFVLRLTVNYYLCIFIWGAPNMLAFCEEVDQTNVSGYWVMWCQVTSHAMKPPPYRKQLKSIYCNDSYMFASFVSTKELRYLITKKVINNTNYVIK